MRTSLEVLSEIRIAKPCPVRWDHMTGDAHKRHCTHCSKSVFNLGEMSADNAVALLKSDGHDLCARLYRRKDGTVMTSDCPQPRSRFDRFRSYFEHAMCLCGLTFVTGCFYHQETLTGAVVSAGPTTRATTAPVANCDPTTLPAGEAPTPTAQQAK